ncbi:MAG: hypothetical protein K8S21_07515 [Gemmatimonadetes bacterium]|nr:hypothetical protein [Gemmatimonadota bacterium]
MALSKAAAVQSLGIVGAVALGGAALALPLMQGMAIMLPVLATLLIAGTFLLALRDRAQCGLIGELGAVYVFFILAYTLSPAFTFLVLNLDLASGWVWSTLAQLLPDESEIGAHLWRHALFVCGFCVSYLYARRPASESVPSPKVLPWDGGGLLVPFVVVVIGCNVLLWLLSAPVTEYADHYSRYDHLAGPARALVSVTVRLESGLFLIAVTLAFMNYRRFGAMGILLVVGALVFKILNSMGSRIEGLFVLLIAVCLYQTYVRRINMRKAVAGALLAGVLFSSLEVLREVRFNFRDAAGLLRDSGVQPASEFGAVFLTGFHLYSERAQGTLPPAEWPMFFSDFVSLVMPNSYVRFNPQYWYADQYFPNAPVPPQTNGPIADSAVWGGEADLLVRALLNGLLFAWLTNFFFARKQDWRVACVYVFCYSTCIMTLKYSIFYHLNPLVKTVLPAIFGVMILKALMLGRRRPAADDPAVPALGAQ